MLSTGSHDAACDFHIETRKPREAVTTMIRATLTSSLVGILLLLPGASRAQQSTDPADATSSIRQMFSQYVEAFNAGDVDALATHWTADAVWTGGDTGERVVGRDAIMADFATLFGDSAGTRLSSSVTDIRQLTPDVAELAGLSIVTMPYNEPTESRFSATLVKQDGKWLMSSVREASPPVPETPYQRLRDLEFLVGEWADDTDDALVRTSVRWGANDSFLIRSYTVDRGDDEPSQGTQVIGWDPLQGHVVSWNFESDGSFGMATWSRDGADWVVRLRQTFSDGGTASATQILTPIDDNTLSVEMVGQEIDGEAVPSSDPVRVVRVDAEPTSQLLPGNVGPVTSATAQIDEGR
jgi:uncharacterized protein (TIGR02246 family)